jgi:hypothetical protein
MPRVWALISLGEERQYGGNTGYDDDLGNVYKYDSSVANSQQLSRGDLIVLRNDEHVLGVGRVRRIERRAGTKERNRCPVCATTALKHREKRRPLWRCDNGHEFDTPRRVSEPVTLFTAYYGDDYLATPDFIPVSELKAAALRPNDQMSIEELSVERFEAALLAGYPGSAALLESFFQTRTIPPDDADKSDVRSGQRGSGFLPTIGERRETELRAILVRRGQQGFRRGLIRRYGEKCMVTGCLLLDIVEAAHIWPYRGAGDHHPENGLLLRCDFHTLFDLNQLAIEPDDLVVSIAPAARAAGYGAWHGQRLLVAANRRPSREALSRRWKTYLESEKTVE